MQSLPSTKVHRTKCDAIPEGRFQYRSEDITQWTSKQMPLTLYDLRIYAVQKYQRVEFYRSVSQILDTLATNGRPKGFAPRIKEEHPTTTQAVSKRVQCKEKCITALRKIQKSMKITNRKDPEEEPSYHRVEKIPECRGAVSHQVQSMK